LIFSPAPTSVDPSSVDLHLDAVSEVKIWDIEKFREHEQSKGAGRPELRVGKYNLGKFSKSYLTSPPEYKEELDQLVSLRGNEVVVRPGGFVLWQTRERVGTPDKKARFICFVDGKSTKARAGIVVHLTAPTIHTSWAGQITLEIVNLGPFDLVLAPGDVIAQVIVAQVTKPPKRSMRDVSVTHGQKSVAGAK
jgi:deoxycytidine triphosphate deaminase